MSVAETVALASDGQVFAPDGNGTIWRAASLNAPLEEWANIGGRPLGAMVDSKGDLLIADAARVRNPSWWFCLLFGRGVGTGFYSGRTSAFGPAVCSKRDKAVLPCN